MGSDDFKTTLEAALQFFPGIKLKRERTEIVPRKPACQTKRRPPQVFVGSGYRTSYFHLPAEYRSENRALFVEGLR